MDKLLLLSELERKWLCQMPVFHKMFHIVRLFNVYCDLIPVDLQRSVWPNVKATKLQLYEVAG